MAELFGLASKSAASFFGLNRVSIDNWTFKCFYKASVVFTISCSIIVTSRQFFGHPIKCDAGLASEGISTEVLDSYCWMYAHFSIPKVYEGPCSGHEQANNSIAYNSYYQWVPLYLASLALLFYIPRCLWLMMEGGLMKFFGKGTTTRIIEDPEEKRDKMVEFFAINIHNKYDIYYFGFIFCELLNLFMVFFIFMVTNIFINGKFLWYGFQVLIYYRLPMEEKRINTVINPMCQAFPRVAACDYHRFGTGGKLESINSLCILSLNTINDKVFLVLWWWMSTLFFLGLIRLIFRLFQMTSTSLRFHMLNIRLHRYFKLNSNMKKIRNYINVCSLGDWFVLYQLSKNLNRPFFIDFLSTLAKKVDPNPESSETNRSPDKIDSGDGILEMILKPKLCTYADEEIDEDEHMA